MSLSDVVLLSSSDKGNTTLLIYLINHLVDLISEDFVEIRIALVGVINEVSILCLVNKSNLFIFSINLKKS